MRFFITIDTEGDNQWDTDMPMTTNNLREVPKFQELVEKFNFKSTYFCNYEAMGDVTFINDLIKWRKRGEAEIGLHIHSWTSPPYYYNRPLNYQSFLIEEGEDLIREKVKRHKQLAEKVFDCDIIAHRAGRWAMNSMYAKILIEEGLYIDSSITPGINWKVINPQYKKNEIDYSGFDNSGYLFRDHSLIKLNQTKVRCNDLLELPMSIWKRYDSEFLVNKFTRPILNRIYPRLVWVRLMPGNKKRVLNAMTELVKEEVPYVMFMLHSSELLEGGSPYFKSKEDIDDFFSDIKEVFTHARDLGLNSCTLEDYRKQLLAQ